MKTKQCPSEGKNSANKKASEGCMARLVRFSSSGEGIPLPNYHGGIEELTNRDGLRSLIMMGANSVFGSDISPGHDLVVLLESPDGIINHLRIILAVDGETDTPRVIDGKSAPCRVSVLWNEAEIVSCVLLTVNGRTDAVSFLLKLMSALAHRDDWCLNSSTNVKEHAPALAGASVETGGEG